MRWAVGFMVGLLGLFAYLVGATRCRDLKRQRRDNVSLPR